MSIAYPNLAAAVARRGIKKTVIASSLGISPRSLYSKMNGDVSFTWEETCAIQRNFFPDEVKDFLFEPFPVYRTVKSGKKQNETQNISRVHS